MRQKQCTRSRSLRHVPGQKPRGCFQDRVKKVGPEHFAIIAVDCGKSQARTRVGDFFGNVLLEPFSFEITRPGLDMACCLIGQTLAKHKIKDCVCAIEITGRYHAPVKAAFKHKYWETRFVHPYTTSLIRRSSDLGVKTDDIDLAAIHRAAVNGLAMVPEALDGRSLHWRLLTRHRRDLVEKASALKAQLKECIDAYLPGFTRLWKNENFWDSPIGMTLATTFDSPEAMRQAPVEKFQQLAHDAHSVIQKPMIDRILSWACSAAPPDDGRSIYHRRACSLWNDLKAKAEEIRVIELELAGFLCDSQCVLLMAFVGINVVSASDYGAELGPITNYATSKSIAGRSGLYPSRYQTSDTDRPDGPLVARRNRQLRAALMRMGHNLKLLNHYFMGLADRYKRKHPDHDTAVVVASTFSRLSYYILAGGHLFPHSAIQDREKILRKLLAFYNDHHAEPAQVTAAIDKAIVRLSAPELRPERVALGAQHQSLPKTTRRSGVRRLGEILPAVLLDIDRRLQEQTQEHEPQALDEPQHEDATHGF